MITTPTATITHLPTIQKDCFRLDFPSREAVKAFESDRTKLRKWGLMAHRKGFKNMGTSICGVPKKTFFTRTLFQVMGIDIKDKQLKPKLFTAQILQFPVKQRIEG